MTLEVTPQFIKTICQPVQKHGRSHVASGPRKGHRKSRQGCVDCKRRKIKCQETLPACENCIRASLQCRYFTHTASGSTNISPHQPITLHETQIFNLTDMRLFHHYLVAAYPHLPVRNDDVWLVYITPIGHQFDFLMHALLALSASHLNKLTTSGLTNVAQAHRLAAIKGLNGVLDQPITTAEQGDAILATCYALLMQSWYMDDGLPAFLIMTRSCELVTRQIRSHDVGSILAEENSDSRIERMRTRLKGAPTFTVECIRASLESLNAIQPLCHQAFEQDFWTKLQDSFIALAQSPIEDGKVFDRIGF
ncbi:hypothetical protein B0J14DRAFT_239082 [Halenospora varia]|nr:hypothetical protein B0J14DRAFT_239082 [Halenospora varia]